MNKRRNLLEKGISVDSINQEAKKEKIGGAKPPLSNMHYYFTRKPLISSRLVIAGALLDESCAKSVEEFNRLMGIDPEYKKRAYKIVPTSLISKVKASYPEDVTILDPFAGSGMIPFEALRLGLNVVALDYNPVSYLILKATLEYPIKFGGLVEKGTGQPKLYSDVKKYALGIIKKLNNVYQELYPKHRSDEVRAYLHAWQVACPTCGKQTPLVNNWWLDRNKKMRLDYAISDNCIEYSIVKSSKEIEGNMQRGYGTCLHCSSEISNDHIVSEISKNNHEVLLAVSLTKGSFELPTSNDITALEKAEKLLNEQIKELIPFIPSEEMPDDKRSLPAKKYITYWRQLFSSRQLFIISNVAKEIRLIVKELSKENQEYAAAVGVYLSMVMANHLNHNSRSTMWINTHQIISNSLFNRGIGMMWNHAEANPFSNSSGSLQVALDNVLAGLNFAIEELSGNKLHEYAKPKVEVVQGSILSWRPNRKFKFIITDPPYYDDVPYPELLQFFQVWHSRTVGDLLGFAGAPSTNEELSVGRDRDESTFENRMKVAIKNLYNLLEDEGTLVMFYAHRSIEGWKYLIEALRTTGFNVTSTIALMTENKESAIARGRIASFHSLVLTARKREENKTISLIDLEDEIRKTIAERYCDLERIYGQDRMNLMLAASGIVIETITSYSNIQSFSKNTADYALEMGQRFLIEAFAKRTLNVANSDPKTMVYTWFRHSLNDNIEFSVFNQTLKALGITEEAIADIYKQDKGGEARVIRLLDFSARGTLEIDGMEPLIAQSIIDAVHIALRAYMRGGVTSARISVIESPFGSKAILNTINALADLYKQKNDYKEGEVCKRFLEEWTNVYGGEQRTFK